MDVSHRFSEEAGDGSGVDVYVDKVAGFRPVAAQPRPNDGKAIVGLAHPLFAVFAGSLALAFHQHLHR